MTGNEQELMKQFFDNGYVYMKPQMEHDFGGCVKMRRAVVASVASGGTMGVQFPFDVDENEQPKVLYLPYTSAIENAPVGTQALVMMPTGSLSSGIVFSDATMTVIGGVVESATLALSICDRNITLYKKNGMVWFNTGDAGTTTNIPVGSVGQVGTLPTGFIPRAKVFLQTHDYANPPITLTLNVDGTIVAHNYGSAVTTVMNFRYNDMYFT